MLRPSSPTLSHTCRDDNTIRGYLPESGKLKFEIPNAHNKVSAGAHSSICRQGYVSVPCLTRALLLL